MGYIGIDLGDKRVGIAISQENIAFAQEIIGRSEIITYLKKYFSQSSDIDTIIVWLPYDLYGRDTKQLEKEQKFIEKLRTIFPEKNIFGHDERFSSFEAREISGAHRDDIAAQCILQSYLDTQTS